MTKTINRNSVAELIYSAENKFFGMTYIKADGSLRNAVCRLHVSNPTHCQKPGEGKYKGQSAEEALKKNNNIKYFDVTVENETGKGAFRTAKIDRIQTVTVNGEKYEVID